VLSIVDTAGLHGLANINFDMIPYKRSDCHCQFVILYMRLLLDSIIPLFYLFEQEANDRAYIWLPQDPKSVASTDFIANHNPKPHSFLFNLFPVILPRHKVMTPILYSLFQRVEVHDIGRT
jgi:hypothetical protein